MLPGIEPLLLPILEVQCPLFFVGIYKYPLPAGYKLPLLMWNTNTSFSSVGLRKPLLMRETNTAHTERGGGGWARVEGGGSAAVSEIEAPSP